MLAFQGVRKALQTGPTANSPIELGARASHLGPGALQSLRAHLLDLH